MPDPQLVSVELVGFVGQRLESTKRPARFHIRWWACARAAFWKIDGGPALRANRLDECHVYRQRSARPGKNLVRALVVGCGSVVVLYLLANLAYIAVLPFSEIEHAPQNRVAVAMMNAVFGHPGAMCMAAAIMISTFGCNNGLILSGARVYYAMARDRLFFEKVGTTNRFHVPAAALVAQGIWTALLTLPRTVTLDTTTHKVAYGNVYNQLLEYIVSADLLFYLLMVVALMILRRTKPDAERPYRTWGYPFVPIISILLAGLLIVDLGFLAPATSGIGILIVLTGVPAYFFWRKFAAIEINPVRV